MVLLLVPGCTTLQRLAALQKVQFDLAGVSNGLVAGVDIDNARTYGDLGYRDIARLGTAIAGGELPLSFTLDVAANNPADNPAAQLLQLDWTLFVDGTETVSGIFNDDRVIQPGQTATLPLAIELDLMRFFGNNLRDLADLALNLAGAGGSPARLQLQAVPTVQTALGPIRYPGTITIDYTVGNTQP